MTNIMKPNCRKLLLFGLCLAALLCCKSVVAKLESCTAFVAEMKDNLILPSFPFLSKNALVTQLENCLLDQVKDSSPDIVDCVRFITNGLHICETRIQEQIQVFLAALEIVQKRYS